MSKIYDCFLFFNELDILEIRLQELKDHVDFFVLVECGETFTGNPKPYYFEENKDRFKEFLPKIIHIKVPANSSVSGAWPKQNFQRNCIERGLTNCAAEDIIMISDLDEIPKGKSIKPNLPKDTEIVEFMMRSYSIFINRRLKRTHPSYDALGGEDWNGTRIIKYKYFTKPQDFRSLVGPYSTARKSGRLRLIQDAGWHFSWMGSIDQILYKSKNVSGMTEAKKGKKFEDKWRKELEELTTTGEGLECKNSAGTAEFSLVAIDDSYPKYFLDNLDLFDYMIYKKKES